MKLKNMSWVEVENYFKTHDTVMIGVGSIECHGMHNPLGVDTIIPDYILDQVDSKVDVLIVPTMPFGSTDYFEGYPGTISLGNELLYQVLKKIAFNLKNYGAKKFIFLNGHGGNVSSIESVCLDLDKEGCIGCCLNWWTMVWDMNKEWIGGHGGAEETAAILAIDDSLVNKDLIVDYKTYPLSDEIDVTGLRKAKFKNVSFSLPRKYQKMTDSGWLGIDHPQNATKKMGEEMLQAFCDYLVEFCDAFSKVNL